MKKQDCYFCICEICDLYTSDENGIVFCPYADDNTKCDFYVTEREVNTAIKKAVVQTAVKRVLKENGLA